MRIIHRCVTLSLCGLLSACGGGEPAGSAGDDEADERSNDAAATTAAFSEACATRDERGELQPGGELVQLDVELRYHTTRSGKIEAGNTSMQLDAEGLVEAASSQLACRWQNYGYAQYDVSPSDRSLPRFPVQSSGHASLNGLRVTSAQGATIREEVAVSGPVEELVVKQITVRDDTNADRVCVMLSFSAPLSGQSMRTIDAGPASRTEEITPSELGVDGYSALAVQRYSDGQQREDQFAHRDLSICGGPTGSIDGLTVSADDLHWTRSGPWTGHVSGPNEHRDISFSMRVTAPKLLYPAP